MTNNDDIVLIRQAQAGNRQAFAALVDSYWKGIYRQLFGLIRNSHAAEDLTQDVFLKAWANLKSFTPGTFFRAWLARIARNAFLNSRRDRRVRSWGEHLGETLSSRDPGPLAALLARETQTRVKAAAARLPATTQAAFWLRTQDQLPFREVGRALAITAATARWHVFCARHQLQASLREKASPVSPAR